ncbi:MAG: alpha/beta hydrolase [Spirochaetales bacterium]|uniref:Alpha/beta hydrolase n=1 Tax=Candidatus Thalassospirochaeta sargassi TaxID=3119039 RepID=A0AAJ1MJQ3_9SPIO|nr:alpha/beta hydrolase [Spirochaetales bacterium]
MINQILKIAKMLSLALLILLSAVILVIMLTRFINYHKTRITSELGIQEDLYIELGGIEQYLQIRGEDINNPVILFLHGGPGFPLSYLSYYYQPYLESDYTFVCWDQRGSGRTYYKNEVTENDLTPEQLLADTDELVEYICSRFQKEKVIIMGQSWGTVPGTLYTMKYPDKVESYIGVGQVIDFDAGKIEAAIAAKTLAKKESIESDVTTLINEIENFSQASNINEIDIPGMEKMIRTSLNYLKGSDELNPLKTMWLGLTSPDVSINDLRWFKNASSTETIFKLEKNLINYMYYGFDIDVLDNQYDVPIYYISGGNDWITPYTMVKIYCNNLVAPSKDMIIIENTGHTPFLDQPESFADAVKLLLNKQKMVGF